MKRFLLFISTLTLLSFTTQAQSAGDADLPVSSPVRYGNNIISIIPVAFHNNGRAAGICYERFLDERGRISLYVPLTIAAQKLDWHYRDQYKTRTTGGLIGFIDDTLKGKMYSAIASNVPVRGGMAQLQRVMAALFAEGREVDLGFLGVNAQEHKPVNSGIPLQLGLPLVKGWPQLSAIARYATPLDAARELSIEEVAHPVMQAMKDNVDELIRMQEDMMVLFRAGKTGAVRQMPQTAPVAVATTIPQTDTY